MSEPLDVVVVGSLNVDLSIRVPHALRRGETLLGSDLTRGAGGKGANQAVACRRLGRRVAMVGAVGDDADGDWMVGILGGEGVDVTSVRRLARPTGHALILVEPDGESTIVVSLGANAALTVGDIDEAGPLLRSARCVLAQQEVDVAVVARAAELAEGLFVLNPAPARAISHDVLERVDVLVPNRLELAGLAGVPPSDDEETIIATARSLSGPRAVVVTLGSQGALVVESGCAVHVPAVRIEAVDATAAGDTFCGALVDGLLNGASLVEAAHWAVRAAAVAVTRRGAMESIPRRAEIVH
jgi:ribokinase